MTEPQPLTDIPDSTETAVFERVVCGVDVGRAGQIAARQAAQVVVAGGSLLLVTVTVGEPVTVVSPAGLGYAVARTKIDAATRQRDCDALTLAREDALPCFAGTRMLRVEGEALASLLETIERERATLAVVGSHEHERLPGVVLGSVGTHLLHKASCSVLVARRGWRDGKPRRVIAGIDGSARATAALHAARHLADRFGSPLEQLTDHTPRRGARGSRRPRGPDRRRVTRTARATGARLGLRTRRTQGAVLGARGAAVSLGGPLNERLQGVSVSGFDPVARRRLARADSREESLEIATPPEFRGGLEGNWSPEDLLVASTASCFALTLAAVAEKRQVPLLDVSIGATGHMGRRRDGRLGFTVIEVNAVVETLSGSEEALAAAAKTAEEHCLISQALDVPVHVALEVAAVAAA